MAEFTFYAWSSADLGMSSIFDLFGGGPFTVAGTPEDITVSDGAGDTIFHDEASQANADPGGDQVAFGDIILDGAVVIPDGASVWNIGEFTVTNVTTGEVGTLIVFGDTASDPIGMSSTIALNVGDELTYSNFVINGSEPYSGLICFAEGTRIETPDGPRPIETLLEGDAVLTQNNAAQPIRWIGHRRLSAWDFAANPKLRPVRIHADALGAGLPRADLLVSRQHRMLVRSRVTERMIGAPEALIAAINLTALPGVYVDTGCDAVAYFHLMFDHHEIIFAEGAPSESLYPGPEALKSVGDDAREELLALFPELGTRDHGAQPARPIPPAKRQRRLIARHRKNNRALVGALPR